MKLIELLEAAVSRSIDHPSQVIRSVMTYLTLPTQTLFGLHQEGLNQLNSRLTAQELGDFEETVTITDDAKPVEITGKRGFKLALRVLPEIRVAGCEDFELDLASLNVQVPKDRRPKFQLLLSNCRRFVIRGGSIANARNLCAISECSNFLVTQLTAHDTEGYGIILFRSSYFLIDQCFFHKGLASGIYCLGSTCFGRIERNSVMGSTGFFNWDAGLHINHCTPNLRVEEIPERSHEPSRLIDKTLKPSYLYVSSNVFSDNRAQGIYCEGCTLSTIENNIIDRNNKEGICFDWGSALNVFRDNALTRNGERAGMSDAEVKADFIEQYPLLADGSSSCKLPGLSIDNGALNFIERNKVDRNFGGGIKLVRTGIGNVICENIMFDNGVGTNQHFKQFHGILLLGMGSGKTEFSPGDEKLDFLASSRNIISGNFFSGLSHYHSVSAEPACSDNVVLRDNLFFASVGKPLSDNLRWGAI